MSTLTGQYISQSYGGLIQLSTSTGIVTGSNTQLQDGLGTNLGIWINGQGRISGSAITSSGDSLINNLTIGTGGGNVNTNTALGRLALANGVTGSNNTAVGFQALNGNLASSNTAVGYNASAGNTTGIRNVSIGDGAHFTGQTTSENVAAGYISLYVLTSGVANTAVGGYSGQTLHSGSYNTFVGHATSIATGSFNTVLGAGVALTGTTNNNIILADGGGNIRARYSGSWTLSGDILVNNITIGTGGGNVNTNTTVGRSALSSNVLGTGSVAIGFEALESSVTSSRNVAIGYQALSASNIPSDFGANTAVGYQALASATTGDVNAAFGYQAGTNITTGYYNTFVGYKAGIGITTGTGNTVVGAYAVNLPAGLTNNIILADGAGNIRARYSGSWTLSGGPVSASSFTATVVSVAIASSTASLNLASGSFFTIDLAGGNTHITAVSASRGQSAVLQLTQPFAGNATVTFNSMFSFPTGSAFTASLSQSAVDILSFISFDGTKLRSIGANNYIPV